MKIALIHDLPSGGAKRTVYETLKRLSIQHEIDEFRLDTANDSFCDLRQWVRRDRSFEFRPLDHFRSPFGRLNQLQRWRDLRRLEQLARLIAAEIDSEGFDVVFAQPCMWTQAPLALRYLKTPSVYFCHEPPRAIYEPSIGVAADSRKWRAALDSVDPVARLYRSSARRLDLEATRAARLVLVNSRFTRDRVTQIYSIRPLISYHGVETELFCPQSSIERLGYVLSVGAIQPAKGFDFLIESLGCVPERMRPNLRLIGNAEAPGYRQFLQRLANRAGVLMSIEVGVRDDVLVRRYNEAAIFAYAPHNEPFGLAPLESMACGTPVVGVAEGGIQETVVNGVSGLLVERHPERFAEAVSRLLQNPDLRRAYGRQAREQVLSDWTWEASARRVEAHLVATSNSVGALTHA